MTLRDFRIKLENILLDYNIHVTQKIESHTLSVFLLDRSYVNESDEINNKIKELVSSNKIQANLFSEHTDFDFYSTRNYDAILAVIKGNELDYLISDCDNSEDGLLKIDFSEINDSIKPEVIEDYKVFIERNYLDYINLIRYLSEVFGKAEPNDEMTPDKLYDCINRTIYINVSNEVDTLKLKEVSDKINKDSICIWNLRATQVTRNNKFVISCMFSRNPYNKNQDLFIKVDDPNNIFSVTSTNSFTSGKDVKYLLWLDNEHKVFSQGTEIINFTTNYPKINLELHNNLRLSNSVEFPCHVKIYKYIVEEYNNDKITKGKQEVLFESKNALIYPSIFEPYLPEYSTELDLGKLLTHITEVSNKILNLDTPSHSDIGHLQYLLSHIHDDSLDLSEVHKLLTDVNDNYNLNNMEFFNSVTSPNLYTITLIE